MTASSSAPRGGSAAAWIGAVAVCAVAPLVFQHDGARSLLTQVGVMIVFALSYNMLLGQSGMLSFGHAIYSGLGAYFAIHAMNAVGAGRIVFPISLLPLVGGLGAMACGVVFGYVTTRRSGTPFAMITLGLGELVFASSLMFPGFFGGEGGIEGNRTSGPPLFGIHGWNLGPQLQVYILVCAWSFLSALAMYALTQTPLGRIANAVRDNPERAEFIGYSAQRVRWLMVILSSFFAGIAGGLTAINFEIVSAENVGALRSGGVLVATFIGGAAVFWGPVLGAIVYVLFAVTLSAFTKAWQLYLGVFFVALVLFAPGGLGSLIAVNLRVFRARRLRALLAPYAGLAATGFLVLATSACLVEMTYHRTLEQATGPTLNFVGLDLDTDSAGTWVALVAATLVAVGAFVFAARRFGAAWDRIQEDISSTGAGHR
ncbi:MAG TPA: branched-chain amino acid ABC transporter permease [Burkholderiaceae bacterium]|nr:branched-chain amino acid ABC transporter permease [Burkholderiaceae bacterium]